jgi:hypothetical protein
MGFAVVSFRSHGYTQTLNRNTCLQSLIAGADLLAGAGVLAPIKPKRWSFFGHISYGHG